jgi:uncharacterized protein
MLSRPQDFAAFRDHGPSPVPPPAHRPVPADRSRGDPVRPVDRPRARGRRGPEPRPAPAPRGAQGDGALVPARLGRPHHRPAGDRHGRPRRPGRCIATGPSPGRRARRTDGHVKRIGIGFIKLYRIVFAWLPPSCRFEPTCSRYTEQAIEKYGLLKRQLDGRQADRAVPPVEPGRLRPGPLSEDPARDTSARPPAPGSACSLLSSSRRASSSPPCAGERLAAASAPIRLVRIRRSAGGARSRPGQPLAWLFTRSSRPVLPPGRPVDQPDGRHRDRDHRAHPRRAARSSRSTASSSSRRADAAAPAGGEGAPAQASRATGQKVQPGPAGVVQGARHQPGVGLPADPAPAAADRHRCTRSSARA